MKPQIKQLITEYAGECSNCKKLSNDLLDLHSKWLSDRQFLNTQISELKAENERFKNEKDD